MGRNGVWSRCVVGGIGWGVVGEEFWQGICQVSGDGMNGGMGSSVGRG